MNSFHYRWKKAMSRLGLFQDGTSKPYTDQTIAGYSIEQLIENLKRVYEYMELDTTTLNWETLIQNEEDLNVGVYDVGGLCDAYMIVYVKQYNIHFHLVRASRDPFISVMSEYYGQAELLISDPSCQGFYNIKQKIINLKEKPNESSV